MKTKIITYLTAYKWAILSGFVAFAISLYFVYVIMLKSFVLSSFKSGFGQISNKVAEFGYDVSYDKFSQSTVNPFYIAEFENLTLRLPAGEKIVFPEVVFATSWFNTSKLNVSIGSDIKLSANDKSYDILISEEDISFVISDKVDKIYADIKGISVKDIVDIGRINYAGRVFPQKFARLSSPSFENHIEVRNIVLNGMLDYPLSQKIDRVYAYLNLVGKINTSDSLRQSIDTWLRDDGRIDIRKLVVNWTPLSLVGQGELNFDEKYNKKLSLNTSSKGIFELIDELTAKNKLDSKGVFVAKILLNNKAFKLHPEDKSLTVVTPIDYFDKKLSVEKITIKRY